ncbi:MAG TPA: hypothetical protein VIJ97_01510 [Candidatus Anoxymicrobiaceae bacterium]
MSTPFITESASLLRSRSAVAMSQGRPSTSRKFASGRSVARTL